MGEQARSYIPRIQSNLSGYEFLDYKKFIRSRRRNYNEVRVLWVEIGEFIDENIIGKFPNLNFLATSTTGLTHLDMKLLEQRKIAVISLKDYPEILNEITSTAEFTWTLFLAVWRKLPKRLISGDISNIKKLRYSDLSKQLRGKQITIIGYGRVGKKVAEYAKAFEMQIKVFDPYLECDSIKNKSVIFVKTLNSVIENSDAIIVCASKLKSKKPILNKKHISRLKNGVVVINTARGSLWDEEAIALALKNKKIGGIGVDVYKDEEKPGFQNLKSPIFKLNASRYNIIRSAHVAGATCDALELVTEFMYKKICEILKAK